MDGQIYIITNSVNNKCYIGKTCVSAHRRFIEHKSKSRLDYKNKIPFHIAMNKIGVDKFSIYELGSYDNDILHDMEKFYIKKYDSFRSGYNSDIGGNGGKFDYSDKEVIEKYKKTKSLKTTAKYFKTSDTKISSILEANDISLLNRVKVIAINKYTIKEFNSMIGAAQWLIDNNYTTCINEKYVKNNISSVLYGISITYLGFNWSFN